VLCGAASGVLWASPAELRLFATLLGARPSNLAAWAAVSAAWRAESSEEPRVQEETGHQGKDTRGKTPGGKPRGKPRDSGKAVQVRGIPYAVKRISYHATTVDPQAVRLNRGENHETVGKQCKCVVYHMP